MSRKKNDKKATWVQYGVTALVVIILYVTGLHTEVIGFVQRGLLATGLMNPDVEQISEESSSSSKSIPADFSLQLIDAYGNFTTLEEMKGKVIFINFWATWCPPCIAEMPSIDKLHKEMGDDVAFVILSVDQDFEKAKAFDKRKGYNLPIYAPAGQLPEMYQASSLPTTYIIDAKGNLALTHKGMADYNDDNFKAFLKRLM